MKLHFSLTGGPHTSTYIWGSSVGRMFRIRAGRPRHRDLFFGISKIFLLTEASRPTMGPTHPVQSRPRDLCQGGNDQDVNITTHIHLAQRSRKRGAASLRNNIL